MFIKCWGSRGSIPVSGKNYLKYGGDTTCMEIRSKNGHVIIVDAGTGIRRLGNQLMEENCFEYDFIFTHAHWDHLMGFPFFKPLFNESAKIRMQGCPFARQYVEKLISRVMAPPNFPIRPTAILADVEYMPVCPMTFQIDSITVTPIPITHPNGGSGYKFEEDGKTFVFLTDNELDYPHNNAKTFEDYLEFSRGADLFVHDAEFTPKEYESTRGWGHSVYPRVLELAIKAGVGELGLFHLNQDRFDKDMDRIVKDCQDILARQDADIRCSAVACDQVFEL